MQANYIEVYLEWHVFDTWNLNLLTHSLTHSLTHAN